MSQPGTQKINARPVFLILFRHNIPSAAKIIRDLYYRGVSSGVLVTRNQVPLPNENLKNLYHQARACDMNSPLIASINSFFNVSNAKNIDHNHRLPTLGYTFDSFVPAQLIHRFSRPAPPSERPCGSLSRPSPKVSIRPGCLRQSLLRFAMVAHPRLHICLSPRSGRYRAGVLDLSQGLDSVNPVKKVILPLKIVADPVPRKTERKIKICKRYIIECIGFCGDGASLMLSNYVVPYQI